MQRTQSSNTSHAFPNLFDVIDLALLRLAKIRRRRLTDHESFYKDFFLERDLFRYNYDVNNLWRYSIARDIFTGIGAETHARIADVGCGVVNSSSYFPGSVTFVGVDYSLATLRLARKQFRSMPQSCVNAGFPKLPFQQGSIDLCICFEVLEHIDDDEQALKELHRVLKPNGYLLLSVPNKYYWTDYKKLIGHYRHYTSFALSQLLNSAGFHVEKRIGQFRNFWRAYHYFYCLLRLCDLVIQKTAAPAYTVYRSRFYSYFSCCLLKLLESRYRDDEEPSTFVLCRALRGYEAEKAFSAVTIARQGSRLGGTE